MKLDFIKLEDLKISAINVRKHGDTSGDDLVPSIKSLGIFQPLLVRKNCEGYEIIAGQRRFNACQTIAESQKVDPLPCAIMEDGDDAKAIEASLAENIARLPMDEINQYEAFLSLTKQGRTIEDIAVHFGVTEKLVKQRLAIANLYTPILNAYRREEIEPRTIRLLTMASTKQQKAWFKLFKDNEAPTWNLKSWLFGGDEIPTSNALFDLETYKGVITSDLFGDDSYFADPAMFWKLRAKPLLKSKPSLRKMAGAKLSCMMWVNTGHIGNMRKFPRKMVAGFIFRCAPMVRLKSMRDYCLKNKLNVLHWQSQVKLLQRQNALNLPSPCRTILIYTAMRR